MKPFFILIISLSISLIAFGQADSLGFTNKAEAKNLMVNGLKEGKWIEYIYGIKMNLKDSSIITGYKSTIYKAGKSFEFPRASI